jgi:hypothetical protein
MVSKLNENYKDSMNTIRLTFNPLWSNSHEVWIGVSGIGIQRVIHNTKHNTCNWEISHNYTVKSDNYQQEGGKFSQCKIYY